MADRYQELLRMGCLSTLEASLTFKDGKAQFQTAIMVGTDNPAAIDFIWKTVNEDGFMDKYFHLYTIPKLEKMLKVALKDDIPRVSLILPIGKLFFSQTMILNERGEPYSQENYVKVQFLNTSRQILLRWSRRLGKSWWMKIDALYHSIFQPNCYSLYMCQTKDIAEEHLKEVKNWSHRNPYIFEFSGGKPRHKILQGWSNKDIEFANGSRMSSRTASNPRAKSGKSPNRLYRDEAALYPRDGDVQELTILMRGQVDREKMVSVVASAPAGEGTFFEKLCFDPEINQFWDINILPMCRKITFDDDGKPTFHDITTRRVTEADLLEDWYNLFDGNHDRFMEQYMLITASAQDRAIPPELVDQFFDRDGDTVRRKFSSTKPCILSYDLGKSMAHRSVVMVLEIQENGDLHIIQIKRYPKGHPIRTRIDGSGPTGVIEDIVETFCDSYDIRWVIGDATTMGTEEHCMDLQILLEPMGISPNNIISYKWTSSSVEHLGKAPLWFNVVRPAMEKGQVRSYFHEDFEWEMRVWDAIPSQTGSTTLLKAEKQTYSDDIIITMMQGCYVAFTHRNPAPVRTTTGQGIYSSKPKQEGGVKSTSLRRTNIRKREPRWRREQR